MRHGRVPDRMAEAIMDVRHHGCEDCATGARHCDGTGYDRCDRPCECPCGDEPSEGAAAAIAAGLAPLYVCAVRARQDKWHKRQRSRARASLVYRYRAAY
jgi:hypothetical protein